MAKKKQKKILVTSPQGVAVYPWIQKPDFEYKAGGEYHVKLRLDSSAAEGFIAELTGHFDALYEAECTKQGKKQLKVTDDGRPWANATDRDTDEELDDIEFSFKRKHKVEPKGRKPFILPPPVIVDSQGNPVNEPVYGGSEIRVRSEIVPWYTPKFGFGIQLRMTAIQVLKLVSSGGEDYSEVFGKSDGFVSSGVNSSEEDTGDEEDAGEGDEFDI